MKFSTRCPDIAFFLSEHESTVDRYAMEPIANEAITRGYDVVFTEDYSTEANIGFYCHGSSTGNTNLSIRMFHGLDDAYAETWLPWNEFDIGLLPGPKAAENWKNLYTPKIKPKFGVFITGWPKADKVASPEFKARVDELKDRTGLGDERTIVYAPTRECHGKLKQFITQCENLTDILLVKHAPYEELQHCANYKSYKDLQREYEDKYNVRVLNREENILACLSLADILISDQSSVLNEAVLTETVPVSVTDWPTLSKPDKVDFRIDFAIETTSDQLTQTISTLWDGYDQYAQQLIEERKFHYSHLGTSTEATLDLVESAYYGNDLPMSPVKHKRMPLHEGYWYIRGKATKLLPERVKSLLWRRVLKLEKVAGNIFR